MPDKRKKHRRHGEKSSGSAQVETAEHPDIMLAYGRRTAAEIIKHRPQDIVEVFLLKDAKYSRELSAGIEQLVLQGAVCNELSRQELDTFLDSEQHQGIGLRTRAKKEASIEELLRVSSEQEAHKLIVALDQVTDPYNLGAIMRAAGALGVDGVVVTKDRSAGLSQTARKVSAGASEVVPLAVVTNLSRTLQEFKKNGFWIVGTSLADESIDLRKSDIARPIVLVLGSEGKGMRHQTEKQCDYLVKIPMPGLIDSLNVGQAGAIAMYQLGALGK
jgi:23S rRNA (guanosine2251-2'-O)-methyltransferase